MTEEAYNQAVAAGQVETVQPPQTSQPDELKPLTLDEYQPVLESLRRVRKSFTAAPLFVPKSFADSIQPFDDGSTQGLYVFINGAWELVGASGAYYDNGNSGSSATIDWSKGNYQKITLTGGSVTLTFSNTVRGQTYRLEIRQDGTGSRTVVWPRVLWQNATRPTLTATPNAYDVIIFEYDGSNYFGRYELNFADIVLFDAATNLTNDSAVSTITASHTCSGYDGVLVVAVFNLTSSSNDPTTCTYGGQAMTKLGHAALGGVGCSIWYLASPPTGSHAFNISVNGFDSLLAVAQSFNGGSGTVNGFNSGSGSINVNTNSAADMVFAAVYVVSASGVIGGSGGSTALAKVVEGAAHHTAGGYVNALSPNVGFTSAGSGIEVIGCCIAAGTQS